MTGDELKEKALKLKEEGKSLEAIGKELGISKSKVHRLLSSIEPLGKVTEEKGFLDVVDRFSSLLKEFGIKDSDRIIGYVSSFDNIFTNPQELRKALTDQLVAPAKALAVVKHWCVVERLSIPEEIAREAETGTQATASKPQLDKWSLIGDVPVRDPDGQYSWLQALQLLEARRQPQQSQQSDSVTNLLISRLDKSDERVEKLLESLTDQRFGNLDRRLEAIATEKREASRYGVVQDGIQGILGEMKGIRGDVKPIIETAIKAGIPPKPPLTPEQRAKISQAGKQAIEAERKSRALEGFLFFGEPKPDFLVPELKPTPPPTIIQEAQ